MRAGTRRPMRAALASLVVVVTLLLSACGRAASAGGSASLDPSSSGEILRQAPGVPVTCPVTRPPSPPFVPPSPPSAPLSGSFWYGTPALWTSLETSGTWIGLPYHDGLYGQKVFWWRQGYDPRAEPQPPLTVTGTRIDQPAGPLISERATNAFASDIGSAMLVGVDIPSGGCWRITGHLRSTELSFVVWIPE